MEQEDSLKKQNEMMLDMDLYFLNRLVKKAVANGLTEIQTRSIRKSLTNCENEISKIYLGR